MQQNLKHLKLASIGVIALAVATMLDLISAIFFGSGSDMAGAPENVVLATEIFAIVISGLLLLPQVYVGVKGLLIAKNPNSSKLHIILAAIVFVISALNLLSSVIGLLTKNGEGTGISGLLLYVLDVAVYFDYIKYARIVAKEN